MIRSICSEHKGRYGYRRVTLALRQKGFQTNHKLVMKIMKEEHLTCKLREKRYRSYRGTVGNTAPNLLQRDFSADKPCQKWATDITEFKLFGKKLYLSPILDLFNGEIISYSLTKSPNFHQVTKMLKDAFEKIPDNSQLILHSDQGWQYQMRVYQKMPRRKESAKVCLEKGIVLIIVLSRISLAFSKLSSTAIRNSFQWSIFQMSCLLILTITIIIGSRVN